MECFVMCEAHRENVPLGWMSRWNGNLGFVAKKLWCALFGHTDHHDCKRCGVYRRKFRDRRGWTHVDVQSAIGEGVLSHTIEMHAPRIIR